MNKTQTDWLKIRILVIFFFIAVIFVVIFLRVLQLQVLEKENLRGLAERQHQRVVELMPNRGTIYDRNLAVMAKSIDIESLYAHPRQISNTSRVARRLSPILETKSATIEGKLKSQQPFVWLQRKISPQKAEKIRNLEIRGINFLGESQRYYPNLDLAANLLGFVGIDSQGLEGVEFQYDKYLRGQPQRMAIELDARGGEIMTELPPPPAALSRCSIVLTIDLNIQFIVEKALSQALRETRAKSAMVAVMAPQSGEILAMASRPSFNPNALNGCHPSRLRNRVITDIFEPGSIFKLFLLATALEEKVVKRNDIFFCHQGSYQIGREIIHDHKKYGWLTLQKVIKFSSNIGASQIGTMVGARRFDRYVRRFGFGAETGIRLPGEVRGIIRDPDRLSEIGLANTSFGQGISVTAIQLVSALSAIANGGILMRPHVVDRIINQKGEVIRSFQPEVVQRVLAPETCLEVTRILKEVPEPGGTGTKAALPGYEVAGKTGTAQKIDPILRKYADDRYIGSFMGYVPADTPRLAILVVIDEPKGTPYGGVVAAPVFRTIAQQTLQYLNIAPTKGVAVVQVPQKNRKKSTITDKHKTSPEKIRAQTEGLMPDLVGLSMRAALKWFDDMNVEIRIKGRGVLSRQKPQPGARLKEGTTCYLTFEPP